MSIRRFHPLPGAGRLGLALSALLLCLPAQALYKVVGPDGKVTYTDRAPIQGGTKVTAVDAAGKNAAEPNALPAELRAVAARYPVTLYVFSDCAPCDDGRALLRQRGIPFTEKLVATQEDVNALQGLTGSREAPVLTIGTQPLRGLSATTWNVYLDSAGYPRESRLPADYKYPAATPLTEVREPSRTAPRPAPEPAPATPPAAPAPAAASGIRF